MSPCPPDTPAWTQLTHRFFSLGGEAELARSSSLGCPLPVAPKHAENSGEEGGKATPRVDEGSAIDTEVLVA